MKKKILAITSSILAITTLSMVVYASQNLTASVDTEATKKSQLQTALDTSNVLESRYNVISQEDIDNMTEAETTTPQTYSLRNAEEDTSVSADKAIEIYNVSLSENTTSLASQLDKTNEQWMVPEIINDEMSFIYLKKGETLEAITEKINKVNVSDERKSEMIERAKKRAGKIYVSRISTLTSNDEASDFVNKDFINNLLENNSISNVCDMKYANITNRNLLAVWVKTNTNEYIIPYAIGANAENITCNKIYLLGDIIDLIVD